MKIKNPKFSNSKIIQNNKNLIFNENDMIFLKVK